MFANPLQLIQQFNAFRASYRGNPQEEVQKLLTSGRISQKQLNELQAMARQLQMLFDNQ